MITYISGGERSGKSSYAQQMALELADNPVYLATARVYDGNFEERVKRHQAERDERWTNIEEPLELSQCLPLNRVVVVDCVTLWLSNFFPKQNPIETRHLHWRKRNSKNCKLPWASDHNLQ